MANRYWIGNGGSWSDTAHWSTTSGGSGGASFPFTNDTANFDTNSFSATGQTVTCPNGFEVKNIVCSATNSPTLQLGSSGHNVYGSMDWTGMTISDPNDLSKKITWTPSIAGSYTLKSGSTQLPAITINPSSTGQTFAITDDCSFYLHANTGLIILTFYTTTFSLGGHTLTADTFTSIIGATINLDNGTLRISGTIYIPGGTTISAQGTTLILDSGASSNIDGTSSAIILSGVSPSDRLTITNNSGSSKTISNSTLTNTILNGTHGFNMVEIIDGGGNDWGDGGGGTGNPTRLYHVKVPPTHVALP